MRLLAAAGIAGPMSVAMFLAAGCGKESAQKFDDYKRKSIAVEAKLNLDAISRGARTYYESEHAVPGSMQVYSSQVPDRNAGPTPALGACCKGASKPRCEPDLAQWDDDPVWQALAFSVEMPHYYSYEYKVIDKGFTAAAYGDIDCDGQYSTFSVTWVADPADVDGLSSSGLVTTDPHE